MLTLVPSDTEENRICSLTVFSFGYENKLPQASGFPLNSGDGVPDEELGSKKDPLSNLQTAIFSLHLEAKREVGEEGKRKGREFMNHTAERASV